MQEAAAAGALVKKETGTRMGQSLVEQAVQIMMPYLTWLAVLVARLHMTLHMAALAEVAAAQALFHLLRLDTKEEQVE